MRKPIRDWRYVVFGIAGKVKFLKSVGTQILNAPVIPVIYRRRPSLNTLGRTRLIGLNFMLGKRIRSLRPDAKFQAASASLLVPKRPVRKGEDGVEEFLICSNEKCRFLLSLREGNKLWRRSELILSSCPECNHRWSSRCPFCVQPLEVSWQNKVQCCTHCSRPLQPEARAE